MRPRLRQGFDQYSHLTSACEMAGPRVQKIPEISIAHQYERPIASILIAYLHPYELRCLNAKFLTIPSPAQAMRLVSFNYAQSISRPTLLEDELTVRYIEELVQIGRNHHLLANHTLVPSECCSCVIH